VTSIRRKARNHRDFWAAKRAAAQYPYQRALIAWDEQRASIKDLPLAEQDAAWQRLADYLSRFDANAPYLTRV
jgi:hypothetical protein